MLPWNERVRRNRPIEAVFLHCKVQPDRFGHLPAKLHFLYASGPPRQAVEFPCLAGADAGVSSLTC